MLNPVCLRCIVCYDPIRPSESWCNIGGMVYHVSCRRAKQEDAKRRRRVK